MSGGNHPLCFALFDRQQNIHDDFAFRLHASVVVAVPMGACRSL
jgi:hypothetical protein